ncbi:hypothetical protein GLOTRDRAFT_133003 [Gloeophyllum trabeum ATCC 11539]|uniref:Uncharacterized protein n=1 Tax=Gloeophyllum trabeum (strain ATCC 11539 / FP-39264 / Madison 617) TaxID=670483 RepID=S7PWD2_GLOTA|nr:uncharacterized protein GLOTRDRAFT_133003 [Gloeophyllum trabeum ATCC 11539]EPQ51632.1 hypothetical protein GLOTRDRAFT_133003 [Gloeophyllum trabeum ATCC 11539]
MLEPLALIDWSDPGEIERDAGIYEKVMAFFMGIYGYDFLQTLWFEWWIITGKVHFKWPYIPYFLGRYSVIAMFAVLNKLDYHSIMAECDVEYKFIAVTFMLGTGCASLNLAIRTALIWKYKGYAVTTLIAIAAVHWYCVINAAVKFIRTDYDSFFGACLIVQTHQDALTALYIATLIFDMLILIASIVGLLRGSSDMRGWHMHDIRRVLFRQGIEYFLLTSLVNTSSVVFARLNYNTIMDIILSVPALVISMIASCHCVTSLILTYQELEKQEEGHEVRVIVDSEEPPLTSRIDIPP